MLKLVLPLFVSFQAFAAPPSLSAKEEKALIAEMTEITELAGVANGGTDLILMSSEFDMQTALKSIAEERPDVFDDETGGLRHKFKTTIGRRAALEYLRSEEFLAFEAEADAGVIEKLEALYARGLIRTILHRTTEEILIQTYLIPEVFDIYVEYERAGRVKTYLLRLHYEMGD